MKKVNSEVKMLPSGDIQLINGEECSFLELLDALGISKEKRKKLTASANGQAIINNGITLQPGDKIVLHYEEEPENRELSFEDVEILYEDDYCLAVYKPAFLLVHSDGNSEDTLTGRVNAYLMGEGWPYGAKAAHRIDYEAQGLVLFGKHPLIQSMLDEQMADGSAVKEYLAIIHGNMAKKHVDLNNPIARDRHDARKMIVYTSGKPAHTHIETLKNLRNIALVKARITSGRRHQIRVHLANNTHPILNDELYGKENRGPLMLESWHLKFKQPFTGEEIDITAPLSKDFKPFTEKEAAGH